jgi:hypothetical protein
VPFCRPEAPNPLNSAPDNEGFVVMSRSTDETANFEDEERAHKCPLHVEQFVQFTPGPCILAVVMKEAAPYYNVI